MLSSVSVTNSEVFSRVFYEEGLDEKWLAKIYKEAGKADIAVFTSTGRMCSSRPDHRLRLEAASRVMEVHGAKFQPEPMKIEVTNTEIQIINEIRSKDYAELVEEARKLGIDNGKPGRIP
jgi:hypothetical protein